MSVQQFTPEKVQQRLSEPISTQDSHYHQPDACESLVLTSRKRDRSSLAASPEEKNAKVHRQYDYSSDTESLAATEPDIEDPALGLIIEPQLPETPQRPVKLFNLPAVTLELDDSPEPSPREAEAILRRFFTSNDEPPPAPIPPRRTLARTYTCPEPSSSHLVLFPGHKHALRLTREGDPVLSWRKVKQELKCAICQDVLTRPVDPVGCGHYVCRSHVVELVQNNRTQMGQMKCPVCREEKMVDNFNSVMVDRDLWDRIVGGRFHHPRRPGLSPSRSLTPLQDRMDRLLFNSEF